MLTHNYAGRADLTGLWTTPDGEVRKLLLPNGRYLVMLRHGAERHQGDYAIAGSRIEYRSDDGRSGASAFIDGVMYSPEGVPLYPEDFAAVA